ncbi:MAG: prepilin-type N-terminal cleavage/methylation domain-containing protein [Planctomycetaceae bacterium]|nr:prepilin-type N-terminal cleavage/methylation domain-containing protein [Planctomycetaceae bacterium]
MTVRHWQRRAGLTLIELVVVLVILAVLAALVIPRVAGLTGQANAATDATHINEVNRAALLQEAKSGGEKGPDGADGLLTGPATGAFFSPFHSGIQIGTSATSGGSDPMLPSLYPLTLVANQLASLNAAGISFVHYNVPNSGDKRPSDSGTSYRALAVGDQVAGLMIPQASFSATTTTPAWTTHGSTFPDRAFNLNPFNAGDHASSAFVVFGVGQPCQLRGDTMLDAPIVQSANPEVNYARVLIVYRVPKAGGSSDRAQYVGSFNPDGTCLNDNITDAEKANKGLSTK